MKYIWLLTLPFYILDQVTKAWVLHSIPHGDVIVVIPGFFNLVQVHNTGAAFGMFRDGSAFFIVLAIAALVTVAVLARKGKFSDGGSRIAAALLAAGVAGNLTDRIVHRHVIDFLDFILPWYGPWPAFNVADSCICVAAFLFVVASVRGGKVV